jgi:hypothetical protein
MQAYVKDSCWDDGAVLITIPCRERSGGLVEGFMNSRVVQTDSGPLYIESCYVPCGLEDTTPLQILASLKENCPAPMYLFAPPEAPEWRDCASSQIFKMSKLFLRPHLKFWSKS